MSLNREAVRRALLSRANARATQHANWNEPIDEALEGRHYQGGMRTRGKAKKEYDTQEAVSGLLKLSKAPSKAADQAEMYAAARDLNAMKSNVKIKATKDGVEKVRRGFEDRGSGKSRGRPKKQTQKDKEDEKLAMEVKGLKDEDAEEEMEGEGVSGGARAYGMGKDYAKNIMEMDDEVKEMVGKGFWSDFGKGFMSVIKPVASVAKAVLPTPVGKVMDAVGLGKGADMSESRAVGGGKKRRAKAGASDKRKARGAMISKLMKEKSMTLGEASKYIKEHNLLG